MEEKFRSVKEHESGSDRIVKQLKIWMSILWSMCKGRTFINEEPLAKLIETLERFTNKWIWL
jgi:hypothetical protein